MAKYKDLYVMISRTETNMAKFIRTCTQYPYNHVSITMDPTLRTWYSFARYHKDAPFYSGFIKEPVERFFDEAGDASVRIFRLEIPVERARRIEQLFLQAGRPETRLVYNYFDAAASALRLKIAIAGAYTCLSFTCAILGKQYRKICDLDQALSPNLFYEGNLGELVPDSGNRDDKFFQPVGFTTATIKSMKQLATVTHRFVQHRFGDLVEQKLHSTVA